MGIAKRFVPNLVKANGEQIGEVFGPNTINKVVSRRLDANFDVNKLAQGAFRHTNLGGAVEMQIYSNNPVFATTFKTALKNAKFKNIGADFNVNFASGPVHRPGTRPRVAIVNYGRRQLCFCSVFITALSSGPCPMTTSRLPSPAISPGGSHSPSASAAESACMIPRHSRRG